MKRADKIRAANEAAVAAATLEKVDPALRDAARREWGAVRKSAREAFLDRKDWKSILDEFKNRDGFYTSGERSQMCAAYTEELINNALSDR